MTAQVTVSSAGNHFVLPMYIAQCSIHGTVQYCIVCPVSVASRLAPNCEVKKIFKTEKSKDQKVVHGWNKKRGGLGCSVNNIARALDVRGSLVWVHLSVRILLYISSVN